MSQQIEEQTYTATDLYVPVQRLQGVPKLAKAATAPPTPGAAASRNWVGFAIVTAIWGCVVWLGLDLAYGGFDKRAIANELEQAKQQAAELQIQNAELAQSYQQQQQAIHGAAAALGCLTNGGPTQ
jgi:hypothetical protein